MTRVARHYAIMWSGWDGASRFLATGVLLAAVLLGVHVVARIIQ